MDMITVSAKTVDEAITKALIELETTSDKLEYEIVDKGNSGILGFIGSKRPSFVQERKRLLMIKRLHFSERYSARWIWG